MSVELPGEKWYTKLPGPDKTCQAGLPEEMWQKLLQADTSNFSVEPCDASSSCGGVPCTQEAFSTVQITISDVELAENPELKIWVEEEIPPESLVPNLDNNEWTASIMPEQYNEFLRIIKNEKASAGYHYISEYKLKDSVVQEWLKNNKLEMKSSVDGRGGYVSMTLDQHRDWLLLWHTRVKENTQEKNTKEIRIPESSKKEDVIAYVKELIATKEKELNKCHAFLKLLTTGS